MKASTGFLAGAVVMLGAYDVVKWRLTLLESWVFTHVLEFGPTRRLLMSGGSMAMHDERDAAGTEEFVSGLWVRHDYLTANRTFHVVSSLETCKGDVVPLVFFHGHLQSWYSMSFIMSALAQRGYCTYGFDLLGYGQSDVDPAKGPYGWKEQADEFAALFKADARFSKVFFVAHDRGAIVVDHLSALQDDNFQMLGYVRCQQSFLIPHALPRPPREAMADQSVTNDLYTNAVFVLQPPFVASGHPHPAFNVSRFKREFSFRGTWITTALAYSTNTIESEWNDLCFEEGHPDRLAPDEDSLKFYRQHRGNYKPFGFKSFRNESIMNCHPDAGGLLAYLQHVPTLVCQGALDPGMPPWTYFHVPDVLPNAQVRFFNGGWFFTIEFPDDVAAAIHTFIRNHDQLAHLPFGTPPCSD